MSTFRRYFPTTPSVPPSSHVSAQFQSDFTVRSDGGQYYHGHNMLTSPKSRSRMNAGALNQEFVLEALRIWDNTHALSATGIYADTAFVPLVKRTRCIFFIVRIDRWNMDIRSSKRFPSHAQQTTIGADGSDLGVSRSS